MGRLGIIIIVFIAGLTVKGQDISGLELLDKAIEFHDPNNNWPSFQGKLYINMITPDKKERVSEIELNLPQAYFKATSTKDDNTIEQIIDKKDCTLKLNGNSTISEEQAKKHRISCERAEMMKNYYTYLYGLPMKLKDLGTNIDPIVKTKNFKGKDYLVLKVTYEKNVGNDIWYFYFDPSTFAMEVYQFFHDESKNDGEYILLSDLEDASGIKMPKTRAWYYNKDDKYLATDHLVKTSGL